MATQRHRRAAGEDGTTTPPSRRTQVRRHPERARYDREAVAGILDEGLVCHLGFVVDGTPYVMPTMYARLGDVLYVHGAPASRMLACASDGSEVCLTVTLLDGLVMARSVFNHSMNYRSVVVVGRAVEITDRDEKMLASMALTEHVCRGRWEDARHPTEKELGATKILRLSLDEASVKFRSGPPSDLEVDMDRRAWGGEVPLRLVARPPLRSPQVPADVPTPVYAERYTRPGWTE